MLRLAWLPIAQHVFHPALTGKLELILRKIVSCEPRTKAIVVSRIQEKLSPANWVQGVTGISRKISHSWAPKNGVQHATAIYPIPRYTQPRYMRSTLHQMFPKNKLSMKKRANTESPFTKSNMSRTCTNLNLSDYDLVITCARVFDKIPVLGGPWGISK